MADVHLGGLAEAGVGPRHAYIMVRHWGAIKRGMGPQLLIAFQRPLWLTDWLVGPVKEIVAWMIRLSLVLKFRDSKA